MARPGWQGHLTTQNKEETTKNWSVTKIIKYVNRRLYICTVIGSLNELLIPSMLKPIQVIYLQMQVKKTNKQTKKTRSGLCTAHCLCLAVSSNGRSRTQRCVLSTKHGGVLHILKTPEDSSCVSEGNQPPLARQRKSSKQHSKLLTFH